MRVRTSHGDTEQLTRQHGGGTGTAANERGPARGQRAIYTLGAPQAELQYLVTFGGRASEVSDDGKITLLPFDGADWSNYRGSSAVNNRSVVKWKVEIEPGGIFEPTIDYSFFTRH